MSKMMILMFQIFWMKKKVAKKIKKKLNNKRNKNLYLCLNNHKKLVKNNQIYPNKLMKK